MTTLRRQQRQQDEQRQLVRPSCGPQRSVCALLAAMMFVMASGAAIRRARAAERVGPETARVLPSPEQLREVVGAGLRVRDAELQRIRAVSIEERFLGENYWKSIGDTGGEKRSRLLRANPDRDLTITRFSTDGGRLRFEAQVFLWSGGLWAWFPMFPDDLARSATDTEDLYYREVSDGTYTYALRHYGRIPGFTRYRANDRDTDFTEKKIREWLGLRLLSASVSESITDHNVRTVGVERGRLGQEVAYVVRLAANGPLLLAYRFWVLPDRGYAVGKAEVTSLDRQRNDVATRIVATWSDFSEVSQVWVPRRYDAHYYSSAPLSGGGRIDGWMFSDHVTFEDIVLNQAVSFSILDDPIPIGARFHPFPTAEVAGPELDAMESTYRTMMARRRALLAKPMPTIDPLYDKAMSPEEYRAIREEYSLD